MKKAVPLYKTARKPAKNKATDTAQTGRQAALLKELWNAAVALRGNIEPADYKRYVLAHIAQHLTQMTRRHFRIIRIGSIRVHKHPFPHDRAQTGKSSIVEN